MRITAIKTSKITPPGQDLWKILDRYLPLFAERSILAITSKVVSICEGRVVKIGDIDKKDLIAKEAEYYLNERESKYDIMLTIKNNMLIPTAGIDESNGNGYYVLWPSDPQKSANEIRQYLSKRFSLKEIGVLITDSKTTPLRRGTTGISIAHSGFLALKNYIGYPDIFGQKLKVTKANIADGLAAAVVLVIGEGDEQTPLATIEDLPSLEFQNRNPSKQELEELHIEIEEDLYAPLIQKAKWKKGG